MRAARARLKAVKVEEGVYQVEFDGEFVFVSEICETGLNYPLRATVSSLEKAKAIRAAGKSFSASKYWKKAFEKAGNTIYYYNE